MSKTHVVVVLCLAVLSPAQAGGIIEFLFGTRPRLVQWFAPAADGDLHARNPFTLQEETFDLQGNGQRAVFNAGIPVERGLVLVGTVCPKTGPIESRRAVSRLDGSGTALEVIDGPRASADQEKWLEYMVTRARYLHGSHRFRGFQTTKPPYFFAIDTGLLMVGAHSVEVFVYTGEGKGASVVLPFRVVRQIDEDTAATVPTLYEANSPPGDDVLVVPTSPDGVSLEAVDDLFQFGCVAGAVGYNGDPMSWTHFTPMGGRFGPQPFVISVVRNGRLDRCREYRMVVDGVEKVISDDADGFCVIRDARPGQTIAPVLDGQAYDPVEVKAGEGVWYPIAVP